MANVTDSASVLVVPSGWSDGVLGSLQPDDGSSDFTFSRGSDLSATRVNEQGLIERDYENLLLQSNNFNTTWSNTEGTNYFVLGGQEGYDGSNDAWLLDKQNTNNQYVSQSASVTGVYTASIYAKKGSADAFMIYCTGGYARFSLNDGSIIGGGASPIQTKTEYVGNGWYKCIVTGLGTNIYSLQVWSTITGYTAGSVYIQDAMLNEGLSAYPYIETTTTTAKNAVILEDQPRIDYTSDNGAVLIEPSRTNNVRFSEYIKASPTINDKNLIFWDSSIVNPEGYNGVIKYQSTTLIRDSFIFSGLAIGTKISYSIFAKSDSDANFIIGGAFGGESATFNVRAGILISQGAACDSYEIIPLGNGWHRYVVNITFQDTQNNGYSYSYLRWYSSAEPIYLWGWQAEKDATSASSYIPTNGTSQTRLKDTATLTKNVTSTGTIYININAQTSRTLTFLGADISVTEGVNKIAMAYSPTALKVSKNGTIVANITRAFDTTALTQIQLGHRNNFEQTTDSINQFLTLDSFLNDTKLNELTA